MITEIASNTLTLPAKELHKLLKSFALVARNSTVPQHGLLRFAEGTVSAMDAELCLQVSYPTLQKMDAFAVNANALYAAVSRLTGEITLEVNAGNVDEEDCLRIKSGRTQFELPLASTEFPAKPETPVGATLYTLDLKQLKRILEFASMAARTRSAAKIAFVLLDCEGQINGRSLRAVGTDDIRIGIAEMDCGALSPFKFLLPIRTCEIICSLEGEFVSVTESESQIFFCTDTVTLAARKLAVKFPDYARYIPKEFGSTITLSPLDALEALKQIGGLLDDESKVQVRFTDEGVILGSGDSRGEARTFFPARLTGPAVAANFNHRLLTDFFEQAIGEVTVRANGPKQPFLFSSAHVRYVLCPLVV